VHACSVTQSPNGVETIMTRLLRSPSRLQGMAQERSRLHTAMHPPAAQPA
jgi:hypothetical protein